MVMTVNLMDGKLLQSNAREEELFFRDDNQSPLLNYCCLVLETLKGLKELIRLSLAQVSSCM